MIILNSGRLISCWLFSVFPYFSSKTGDRKFQNSHLTYAYDAGLRGNRMFISAQVVLLLSYWTESIHAGSINKTVSNTISYISDWALEAALEHGVWRWWEVEENAIRHTARQEKDSLRKSGFTVSSGSYAPIFTPWKVRGAHRGRRSCLLGGSSWILGRWSPRTER